MTTREIKENIHWVGVVDWNIRDFHGYSTYKGTTYNSFLVMDEKIALVDTVKKPFKQELIDNIRELTDPEKIDYIIVNHVEMDHSGCLPEMIDLIKPEKIFCSPMGHKALLSHFHREDWPYEIVKSGDSISLGKKTVHFLETKMLHWPDSMFSYFAEDKLLISSDAFGQHWSTSERFDDEVDKAELMSHASKYYANILMIFSPNVRKLLEKVAEMELEIDMIAPDHGLIWRENVGEILESYGRWARQEAKQKAVIVYDTMWKSTETMAKAIYKGLLQEGISIKMMDLKTNHRSDIVSEVLDAKAVLCGSPTLNNGMLPTMADLLTYLKGLRPTGKIGAAFGSFGWSGEAVKHINGFMEQMKFDILDPGIKVKNVPTDEDLQKCVELGRKVGQAIKG
ncbi:MAG: flavodoxin domain-containing protein [Thermodesulfobacteriota bacterium]|nr:flavodoxin domain-containing protein [Thermodesulfobacteriota bacterium]